jgi:hypothetical protein
MMYNSLNRLLSDKPKSSYPDYITNEINLVSFNKENSIPIGSFNYRAAIYPGDIDIFEYVKRCCNEKDVINYFTEKIREIVINIIGKRNHWFLELKAGLDERYKIDINDFHFIEKINELYLNNLLNKKEYDNISSSYNNKSELGKEIIEKVLRNRLIIRWTSDEVIHNDKILPGGIHINVQSVLLHKSQINIETLAVVNNKITDISNFFVLIASDKDGNNIVINLSQELLTDFYHFFSNGLKKQIYKLYYSILDYDYLKLVKRYWSFGRFTRDKKLIEKAYPLLNTDLALAGQLKSELGSLIKLLEHTIERPRYEDPFPMYIFKNQLSVWKSRLTNVLEISNVLEMEIDEKINYIINNNLSNEQIIEILQPIKDTIFEIINENMLPLLKQQGLAPPPNYLLPSS